MMMVIDGNGIAVVIAACVAGLVSLGTFTMQVVSYIDQRNLKKAQDKLLLMSRERDKQISTVKSLVNGQSERLQAYVAQEAYEKGREHERVAPGTPSPQVAVVPRAVISTAIASTPETEADLEAPPPRPPGED